MSLVEHANDYSAMLGLTEPPALPKKTIGKMGLKGVPGLRIAKDDGNIGNSGRGGGGNRGGRGGNVGRGGSNNQLSSSSYAAPSVPGTRLIPGMTVAVSVLAPVQHSGRGGRVGRGAAHGVAHDQNQSRIHRQQPHSLQFEPQTAMARPQVEFYRVYYI